MNWPFLLLIPVFMAGLFWVGTTACVIFFVSKRKGGFAQPDPFVPFVSLIRPVCGLEKDLLPNLASACRQDYPAYEVIFAVQRKSDPALAVIEKIVRDSELLNTRVVIDERVIGTNGKVNNLHNASRLARGEVLVFSDTDMFLEPDYLKNIVAPLADAQTGVCCTIYRAWNPKNLYEALALLSFNTDFIVSIIFAVVTRTALACTGANMAMRRGVLQKIDGLAPLCDFYVEDYELGRRAVQKGYRIRFIPYSVKMSLDIQTAGQWWRHQVCWDQKTRSANPSGFILSLFVRGLPFACLYAAAGGTYGMGVLLSALGLRIFTAMINAAFLGDLDALKYAWLLPLRDILGVFVWLTGLVKKKGYWRGRSFVLKHGRMLEKET